MKDWKQFETNNKTTALNVLFPPKNKETRKENGSKHDFKCKNMVIRLMITDSTKWYYLAVENLSVSLRVTTRSN